MKDEHKNHLEDMATQCDRAIVRMTLKDPKCTDLADVGYVTSTLAMARDALRWAAKR